MVTIETNFGTFTLSLDLENTPLTAKNFIDYAESGHYNDTIFHRVIDGFMIQGGGFTADMNQKTSNDSIQNEADKGGSNKRGTIAMARTNEPHSASNQFFINVKDNHFLDFKSKSESGWGYCVFGEVTEGMDVVDAIRQVATTHQHGHSDVPVEPVIIKNVTVSLQTATDTTSTA